MISVHLRGAEHPGGVPCGGTISGCSAAWLARLTGGQKVGGSNPLIPTIFLESLFAVPRTFDWGSTPFIGLNVLLRNRFTSRFALLLRLPSTFGVSPVLTSRPFFPSLFPPRIVSRFLAVIGFFQMR